MSDDKKNIACDQCGLEFRRKKVITDPLKPYKL